MVRPKAVELTARELAIMHVYWQRADATAEEVREALASTGEKLAYATVANVIRVLTDKGALTQLNDDRPFRFAAQRSFEDVSKNLVGDLIRRVFAGSREALLVQMFSQRKLTAEERSFLVGLLQSEAKDRGAEP
jgi:predicted transcriptional regulator